MRQSNGSPQRRSARRCFAHRQRDMRPTTYNEAKSFHSADREGARTASNWIHSLASGKETAKGHRVGKKFAEEAKWLSRAKWQAISESISKKCAGLLFFATEFTRSSAAEKRNTFSKLTLSLASRTSLRKHAAVVKKRVCETDDRTGRPFEEDGRQLFSCTPSDSDSPMKDNYPMGDSVDAVSACTRHFVFGN